MMPIATGLSLAALYDEQEEAAPVELASSSSRPRWTLAHDYEKVTPSELKWELVLGRAWNEVAAHLSPRNININTVKPATQSQTASLAHIMKSSYDAPRLLVSNFLDEVSASFSWIEADIKRCMQHLEVAHLSRGSNVRLTEVMNALFDKLYRWEKEWGAGMKWIDGFYKPPIAPSKSYCQTLFRNHYQALLFDILPSEAFHHHLKNYFRSTLPPLRPLHHPSNRAYEFELPNRYLYRIGILPKYASMLADVAYEQLGRVVRGDWDEPVRSQDGVDSMDEDQGEEEGREWKRRMLRDLQVVVRRDILGWFFGYIEAGGSKDEHRKHNVETRIKHRLQMDFYEYRCQQMFDIIVNFPASLPALADMQDCDALTPPLRRTKLAPVLNESINQRLLHPGAETKDIIRGYILIIKALRVVDPSGVLLHSISQPIKAYLKSRSDAVASIVSMLVETDELADESDQIRGIREINVRHELAEEWIDQKWDPEPIDAAPEFRAKKPNDILSILVGMYDSRDVIVTEIQMWLARQLLNVKNYDYDEHFAKVETLKKRFGDTTLQVCEIMLKDMTDSKRLNAQVQRVQENQLEPIILSHHYWPSVAGKRIRLPRALRRMQKQYSTAFNKVKQDKHMKFFNMLGSVSLTIEVGDRSVICNATPLQAAVLDAVSKKGQCTWQQISDRTGMDDEKVIKHALNHWINHGILHSSNDGSYSASDKPEVVPEDPSLVLFDTAEAVVLETPLETRADMETHRWTEIQRLLAGGASFNTFILHRLLSRDPTYANSKESLERFLGMTARTGLIETTTNGWRLPKVST